VKQQKERVNNKKEQQIDAMSNEDVVNELKEKKLPTFGTAQERKDRLKKHLGKEQVGAE
jgi:type II secretory pathway component PulF